MPDSRTHQFSRPYAGQSSPGRPWQTGSAHRPVHGVFDDKLAKPVPLYRICQFLPSDGCSAGINSVFAAVKADGSCKLLRFPETDPDKILFFTGRGILRLFTRKQRSKHLLHGVLILMTQQLQFHSLPPFYETEKYCSTKNCKRKPREFNTAVFLKKRYKNLQKTGQDKKL